MKYYCFLFFALLVSFISNGQAPWNSNSQINNTISTSIGTQQDARIVSDGKEGAIIVWGDKTIGTGDIYAQRIDKGQTIPKNIGDGNGGTIISWKNNRISNLAIYYAPINSFRLNKDIAAITSSKPRLNVFLNPCRDLLSIQSSNNLYSTTFSLVSLNGQTFFTKNNTTHQTSSTFVLPNVANGMYLFENSTSNTLLSNT